MSKTFIAVLLLSLVQGALAVQQEKEQVLEGFKREFLKDSCVPESYEMSCFSVTYTECMIAMEDSLNSCIGKIGPRMPARIELPALQWGRKLGVCTGENYETRLKAKRETGEKCSLK